MIDRLRTASAQLLCLVALTACAAPDPLEASSASPAGEPARRTAPAPPEPPFTAWDLGESLAGRVPPAHTFAISEGIDWLVQHQSPDGRWSPTRFTEVCTAHGGPVCDGAFGADSDDFAATALATLALQTAGHHIRRQGGHSAAVRAGLKWLLEQPRDSGLFAAPDSRQPLRDSALATVAIGLGVQVQADYMLEKVVRQALPELLARQGPDGGWAATGSATPGASDAVTSAWVLRALCLTHEVGLPPDQQALDRAVSFLAGRLANPRSLQPDDPAELPALMFCVVLCDNQLVRSGWRAWFELASVALQAEMFPPGRDPDALAGERSPDFWAWAAQVLHQQDRLADVDAELALRVGLRDRQQQAGATSGSWNPWPGGPASAPALDRVRATALALRALQARLETRRLLRPGGS